MAKALIAFFLAFVSNTADGTLDSKVVHFQHGIEYWYSFHGMTSINEAGTFMAQAMVGIVSLNDSQRYDSNQHCRLLVQDYSVHGLTTGLRKEEGEAKLDFSKWTSFEISANGEITSVYYKKSEDPLILSMKKIVLSLISTKLFISKTQEDRGQRWGYETNETSHEGQHGAIYQAEPGDNKKLTFTKTKKEPHIKGAHHKYEKVVMLHREQNVPQEFHTVEEFATPTDKSGSNGQKNSGADFSDDANMGLPAMGGKSHMSMTMESLIYSDKFSNNNESELMETTLLAHKIPPRLMNFTLAETYVETNNSCIRKYKDSRRSIPCFRNLIHIIERLSNEDIQSIVEFYRHTNDWLTIIDALGAAKTNDSLTILTDTVLKSANATAKEIMHALVHFIDIKDCLPWNILEHLEKKVFTDPWKFEDEHVTSQVNDRVMLILGAVVHSESKCNMTWVKAITRELETIVGIHDPYHHREMRATKTDSEIKRLISNKCLHLHALGNAAQSSSFDYFVSYLNTSESHMQLRFSAVHAVSGYHNEKTAQLILSVALTDEEDNVRLSALESYKKHPYGGDLSYFVQNDLYKYDNLTDVEHIRIRRDLIDVVSRIWKGFSWKLAAPSVDWKKAIGGEKVGASFGLLVKNVLDIKIAPLSGHLIVDVHDKAWVTIHAGIIGMNFDIFRAEICYKGKIEYKLNILGEFGFSDLNSLADLYNNNIKKIVDMVKSSIANFQGLVSTYKDYNVGDIFNDFVDSVKALPKDMTSLRKVARKVLKALEEYADLPPVYTLIKDLITKVTTLLNNIKTDVMTLYNAIVDTVSTTLPWAWDEIRTAFKGIIEAFKNILNNPKTSFQNMGKGVARISTAIAAVLDAKDKLVEANIFAQDNRPEWFDVRAVVEDLWNDIKVIKNATKETIEWLKTGPNNDDGEAERYTGVDLKTMKKQALQEVLKIIFEDLLKGPIEHIKRFLDPFLKTYKFFMESIQNIKEAWRLLLDGYQKGKTLLDMVFGPKLHKDFPRKYLESTSCLDGFWETNGQGNYRYPGVHAEIAVGTDIVAPFNGYLYDSSEIGESQVTIDIDELKNTQIILDNVEINPDLNGTMVGAGDVIGKVVRPNWCEDGHVHLAMRKKNSTTNFINPSRFMERRMMPLPIWREECDLYLLNWMGRTISTGSVTNDPEIEDKTPDISNAPSSSDLEVPEIETNATGERRKRSILDNTVGKLTNFTKSLGLQGLDKLKEIFNFNINNLTLGQALNFLDDSELSGLKEKIIGLLKKIEGFVSQRTCNNPHSMDDNELKAALSLRGKSTSGARKTLIQRYLECNSECYGIQSMVKENIYCAFQPDCLGLSCCLDLKFFIYRHAVSAFVRYDPCSENLIIRLNKWIKSIHVASPGFSDEGTEPIEEDTTLLNVAQLVVYYSVKQEDNVLKVSIGVRWCSTKSEECQEIFHFIREAQFEMKNCSNSTRSSSKDLTVASALSLDSLMNTTIKDLIKFVEFSGLDEDDINDLRDYLREAFQSWLRKQIDDMVIKIFGNEFELSDMCMKGLKLSFGPYKVNIFSYTHPIPLGPIVVTFSFGAGGYYGADFQVNLCVLSMKATATVTPTIGSSVYGAIGIGILIFRAELRLTGYLLTTSFPTKAEIEFNKFPLDVRARMDLVLIPLILELDALLIMEINLLFIKVTTTLIKKRLWSYTSTAIKKNIFILNDAEPDLTPPDVSWYAKAKERQSTEEAVEADEGGGRKKRSVAHTPRCEVYQIPGRDYTDPAFVLQLGADDDKSPVYLSYCAGTFSGGCDVVKDEELGGNTATVARAMNPGQNIYFTVTAKNNAGLGSQTTCELSTYDMTLPTGRIIPHFQTTSHPEILRASVLLSDDSVIVEKQASVGHGKNVYGTQIIDWEVFTTTEDSNKGHHFDTPLTKFANPKEGRLAWKSFYSESHDEVELCAKRCLYYQSSKCQGFNYDHIENGLCELLDTVEGEADLMKSNQFYYYERLGIGHVAGLSYEKLQLKHNTLNYFNVHMINKLGYNNVISSKGVLVDLTTPFPGLINNAQIDTTISETCELFTPSDISHRCISQTTVPNFRYIIDGEGSMCVFNGHKAMVEERYTRANRMASANWDGIHDNETGILMYTWSFGEEPCSHNIHPHTDPHGHLSRVSEWSHKGSAFPLNLKDGAYFVTVRALNKAEFGGPLCLTVCHNTPLIVDNTPPVIQNVGEAGYDEDDMILTMLANASDDLSLIKKGEIGLGRSTRDTYILEWQDIDDYSNMSYKYRIPDGIPVWVKTRVTNNVDLKTVGHAPRALFVDLTPPIPGWFDNGTGKGVHRFQWQDTELCVAWQGFYDPESGISAYKIALGRAPNATDIRDYVELFHTNFSYCFKGLSLIHNTKYYATIIAFNGAHDSKNVSKTSEGDITPPVKGNVKDNLPHKPDIMYSSDPATVKASWNGFYDPESGIKHTKVDIKRQLLGTQLPSIIHTEAKIDPSINQIELHHLHLLHGDYVTVAVNDANQAGDSTTGESDGFMVDMTKPLMLKLYDGYNVSSDRQFSKLVTSLAATWDFKEPESGIVHYEFTAYVKISSGTRKVYPKNEQWKELDPSITFFQTDETLALLPGAVYFIRVAALNGAGLTAVHDTDGVKIDTSPPTMQYVHANVHVGESEEVIDGFVFINNQENLLGSWSAIDPESEILEYLVSLGSTEGDDDIMVQTSFGQDQHRFITNINLTLTNKVTNIPVYYINVMAVNRAGMNSSMKSSSPIKVVAADQNGNVWDGPGLSIQEDIKSMLGHYTVSLRFNGFESDLNGISHYKWALGTRPKYDDVKAFSSYGLISEEHVGLGLGSSGFAHDIIELRHNQVYFATVRAITGAGNVLDASSDGFKVDEKAPIVDVNIVNDSPADSVTYVDEPMVKFAYDIKDEESDVEAFWISVGSYPGNDGIIKMTKLNDTMYSFNQQLKQPGQPNYLTVTATNEVGLSGQHSSKAVVFDNIAPTDGHLICPAIITSNKITCQWHSVYDKESGIKMFLFGIGSAVGLDNIVPFIEVSSEESSYTFDNESISSLLNNIDYYATLKIENVVGMTTYIYSTPMQVDNTAPVGGLVVELSDYYDVNLRDVQHSGINKLSGQLTTAADITCQRDFAKVNIAWEEFIDNESLIDYYKVALGVSPGSANVYEFTRVSADLNKYTFHSLDLTNIRKVYATVRGYNKVGLSSLAISDGVYISRVSAGFEPLSTLRVMDGTEIDDVNYQYENDRISAHWDLTGDPCPVSSVQWSIVKFDGTIVLPMDDVSPDKMYAEEDDIQLHDGESFFVHLRVTNLIGYSYSLHSDGITIKLQPLMPGNVRDGDIIGVDLNYQPLTTSLSANWDGFGSDRVIDTSNEATDIKIGKHQEVHYYEVALGTGRRYPTTRNDIHPFINVGLNKTWTFEHLQLIPKTSVYYVTVRAISLSTTSTEVTSNGIRVGYGGKIVSIGKINLERYVASSDKLFFSWSEFQFMVPVLRYYWALKSGEQSIDDIDCTNMITMENDVHGFNSTFSDTFDFVSITEVATDQVIEQNNLNLTQGEKYTIYVLSVDESGTCAMASTVFTIDTTPPTFGTLGIGPDLNLDLLYIPQLDRVSAWWKGFNDSESGIKSFQIALMLGIDCYSYSPYQMTSVVEYVQVPPLSTNHTFLELDLKVGEPYYVVLKVKNEAGLEITSVSKPILADVNEPTAGKVVDGTDFKKDVTFIGTSEIVKASILYLPNPNSNACPFQEFPMTASNSKWDHIVHAGMWLIPENYINNIMFQHLQITYGSSGMTLTMEYDVQGDRFLSGAVLTKADVANSGRYEIKSASDFNAVTAITFVDWGHYIFSDVSSQVLMNKSDANEMLNPIPEFNGYKVIPDPIPEDTFPDGYDFAKPNENSFGMHIVKDEFNQYHMILWAVSKMNSTRQIDVLLSFDASVDWHSYLLLINDVDQPDNEDDWSLKLLIDGKYMAELVGISSVNENASLLLGVYNNHGIYSKKESMDVFNVPRTQAVFRNLKFSASSSDLCRYGSPFTGSDHPLVKFYAGIGSAQGLTDVVEYKEVFQPCIPCQYLCDRKICDRSCDANAIQLININLKDLNLPELDEGQSSDNISLPAPYFISVKGTTGSGKSALAYSNGFYIDTTPPIIRNIYHIDAAWNNYEPSDYQGSNSTILVYWEGVDEESEITEYRWAIGTAPFETDIQEFISVEQMNVGLNIGLEGLLMDNKTYYATILAFNAAGLSSKNSSLGVTVNYKKPNVSTTKSSIEGSTPIGDENQTKTVASTNQEGISFTWETPTDQDSNSIHCSVGTSAGAKDIFPEIPCGFNNSGSVQVTSDGVSVDSSDHTNLTDVKPPQRRKRSIGSQLLLEPGRVVYPNVKVCNRAHLCNNIPMDRVIIMKQHDRILETNTTGYLTGRLLTATPNSVEYVEIKTKYKQESDFYLVFGILSPDDFKANYKSDASNGFKPNIVDPDKTINNTDRELYHRVKTMVSGGFYITGIPGQAVSGPLIVTIKFPDGVFSGTSESGRPTLLMYCSEQELWVDAGKSCGNQYVTQVDWDSRILTTAICNNKGYCEQSVKTMNRVQRQTQGGGYSGSHVLALGSVDPRFINAPPLIIPIFHFDIPEDETIKSNLKAYDPDNDNFIFLKNESIKYTGNFTLSANGAFTYRPCLDCFGIDLVHFVVTEVRNDGNEALKAYGVLTINITDINDNPELILVKKGSASDGRNIVKVDQYHPSTRVKGQPEKNGEEIILVSYDVDLDTIKVIIENQTHGSVFVHTPVTPYDVFFPDCSKPWADRKPDWDNVVNSIKRKIQFVLPIPCGVENAVINRAVNRVVTIVSYTPNIDFTGQDSFKVIARDSKGGMSSSLTINMFVLTNPCLKKAKCSGPSCTDSSRKYGYLCHNFLQRNKFLHNENKGRGKTHRITIYPSSSRIRNIRRRLP